MTDAEATATLVARAQRGDARAMGALVRAHLRPAYAVALAVLGAPADAEDVAQETLLVAFERLAECREPARFAAWLLQIVRNRAKTAFMARKARGLRGADTEGSGEGASEAPRPERVGLRERLLASLDHLAPTPREVVLLHDLEGWTHPEIAAALEISEVNSRQHLFNARRLLRGLLQDDALDEARHGR